MADPLADLDDWCDDDLLDAAQSVIDDGAPETESDRASLLRAFGEESNVANLAALQLRLLRDRWCAVQHPTPTAHRVGMVELREEEFAIEKARHAYRQALTALRMTYERKQARAALVDAALAFVDRGAAALDTVEDEEAYEALFTAAHEFKAGAA